MEKLHQEYDRALQENRQLKFQVSKIENEKRIIEQEKNKLLHDLVETRNSKTYRLAKFISDVTRTVSGKKGKTDPVFGKQRKYTYMISVVMAVYNTVDFLEEMLESVLAQKQDVLAHFLLSNTENVYNECVYDNIYELILIDDGSDDGTEGICDKYAKKYPWIKVLHKENGGVSSARNAGIEMAAGKYITFPDSDDKLTPNVFEDCFLFFERHEKEIAMVTYPLRFFDAQDGDHWTTYRFNEGTRVVNMLEEWDKPQYFTAASFFKTDLIRGKIFFDCNLNNGEDIKFANEVMFQDVPSIGLISTCTYWYRRRSGGNRSAIQQSKQTEEYYVSYITDLLEWLKKESGGIYGKVPQYIQYTIMGQVQWRLRSDPKGEEAISVIGEERYREYVSHIKELVKQFDVDVILAQKQLFREHLFYLCKICTDNDIERIYENENISYYFENKYCTDAASTYVKLEYMEIEDGVLRIEGKYANLEEGFDLWVQIGTSKINVTKIASNDFNVYIFNEKAMYVTEFLVEIPLKNVKNSEEIIFGESFAEMDVIKTQINLGKFMPINKNFSWSYYSNESWSVRLVKNKLVVWNLFATEKIPSFEEDFEKQVLASKYGKNANMLEAISIRREAISRLAWKKRCNQQIWLISDRYSHADDNGEAFFLYLEEHLPKNVIAFFVIDRDAPEYQRLSEIGPVVPQDSREHKILHLIADCIISSQADEYVIDPFWRQGAVHDIFKDFYCRNRFVFLQHGVIKDDLSKWLNRFNKNIDGFVCAAIPEAKSIRECEYDYDEQVWLTGLPRYDRLYHDEKKFILVMPTWRKWLMQDFNAADSDRDAVHVIDDIENTEFFEFYSSLLNNERLLDECERLGYKLCYMPHTNFRECMDKFCKDERILKFSLDMPYRKAFAEANLLITDYSSTPMDFAYLRKPVIYAQFDKERFFSGEHTYDKGYFEYERDGFGEVVYKLEDLVDLIIRYMENDCILSDIYKKRIDSFFAYDDKNNCDRVYRKILDLMGLGEK